MQKLTYINLRNEQIVFHLAPYVLKSITGLGLPDVEYETIRGVYQQGDTTAGYRRAARPVSVTFSLLGTSREQMYAARVQLQAILSPDRASYGTDRAKIIYENDYGRWQTCAVPDGGLEATSRIRDAQPNMKLTFRCECPYWFAMTEDEAEFSYTESGFTLPFRLPIRFGRRDFSRDAYNTGHVDAPVQIWIVCKGETPRLVNSSTGTAIAMSSAVPEGYTIYLNTDPAQLDARITDPDGNESGAFGRLSLDTPLAEFVLRPGLKKLVYESGGASARSICRVRWRSAYEGV